MMNTIPTLISLTAFPELSFELPTGGWSMEIPAVFPQTIPDRFLGGFPSDTCGLPLDGYCGLACGVGMGEWVVPSVWCVDAPDEDSDVGDEEDLAVPLPAPDEESTFDDFDDDFDDDFEEDDNDPDWDHPDDAKPESPPPGKGGGKKK